MIIRLLVCFVVSILVHLLIIIQPLHFTTEPTEGLGHTSAVPVSLVDIPQQLESLRDVKITPNIPDSSSMNKKDGEGVSFVAEGGVGRPTLVSSGSRYSVSGSIRRLPFRRGSRGMCRSHSCLTTRARSLTWVCFPVRAHTPSIQPQWLPLSRQAPLGLLPKTSKTRI